LLLVVDGLAHYTRFGFAMKPTAVIGDRMGNKDGDGMTRGRHLDDNDANEGVLQQP
jgi:hypothetical protein